MKIPQLTFALYLVLVGAWLTHEATSLHPRFGNLADSVDSQSAILEQRIFVFEGYAVDYPVWRNRLIVPLLIAGIDSATPLSKSQAYLIVRWLTSCLALAAFAWLLRSYLRANGWFIALALGAFALSLGPTFLHIYDIPSDFLDAAAIALLTLFSLQRRPLAFFLVFIPALLNREGAIFAVALWAVLHAWPLRRASDFRNLVFPGIAGLIGVVLVLGVRWGNGLPAIHSPAETLQPMIPWAVHAIQLKQGLLNPSAGNPIFYLAGFVLLFGLLIRHGWPLLKPAEQKLTIVAVGVFLCSALFGNIAELRTQMTAIVWFVLLSITIVHRHLLRDLAPIEARAKIRP